jgi:hypothetical protein
MATIKGMEYAEMLQLILQTAEQRFSNNGNSNGNGNGMLQDALTKFNKIELDQMAN